MNRQPTDTAQKIFDFIKLPFGETTKKWILRNTGRTSRKRRTAFKSSDFELVETKEYPDRDVFIYQDAKGNRRSKVKYHSDAVRPAGSGTSARNHAVKIRQDQPKNDHIVEKMASGSMPSKRHHVVRHGEELSFSTNRKASDVLERWPSNLPYEVVKGIDEGCGHLLQTFGYKMVGTEKEYEDKTISYLPELPEPEFTNNDTLYESNNTNNTNDTLSDT